MQGKQYWCVCVRDVTGPLTDPNSTVSLLYAGCHVYCVTEVELLQLSSMHESVSPPSVKNQKPDILDIMGGQQCHLLHNVTPVKSLESNVRNILVLPKTFAIVSFLRNFEMQH